MKKHVTLLSKMDEKTCNPSLNKWMKKHLTLLSKMDEKTCNPSLKNG
jgi:hypothetical protein